MEHVSASAAVPLDADSALLHHDRHLDPQTLIAGLALGIGSVAALALSDVGSASVLALPLVAAAVLAVVDQATARIRTRHAVALAIATLVIVGTAAAAGRGTLTAALIGAALWTIPFFALAIAGAAGGGDFKYATALGLMTGWLSIRTSTAGLLLAVVAAGAIAVTTALRRQTMRTQVRLGVPMYVGAAVALTTSL